MNQVNMTPMTLDEARIGLQFQQRRIQALELQIKTEREYLGARLCSDHSGKWERGRCLMCELERLPKTLVMIVRNGLRRSRQNILQGLEKSETRVQHHENVVGCVAEELNIAGVFEKCGQRMEDFITYSGGRP